MIYDLRVKIPKKRPISLVKQNNTYIFAPAIAMIEGYPF
jgi:hypothetical protein